MLFSASVFQRPPPRPFPPPLLLLCCFPRGRSILSARRTRLSAGLAANLSPVVEGKNFSRAFLSRSERSIRHGGLALAADDAPTIARYFFSLRYRSLRLFATHRCNLSKYTAKIFKTLAIGYSTREARIGRCFVARETERERERERGFLIDRPNIEHGVFRSTTSASGRASGNERAGIIGNY